MYLPYLQRNQRWIIEVIYEDETLKRYGPFFDPTGARGFLESRIAESSYEGPRRQNILGARVVRSRRAVDGSRTALIGVRFVKV